MLADPALEHTFHPDTRCRKEQMDSHVDYTCFSSLPIIPLLHDPFFEVNCSLSHFLDTCVFYLRLHLYVYQSGL